MTEAGERPVSGRRVVYVVAKAPRSGISKTRLSPTLAPEAAAHLAAAFLLDSVHIVRQAGLDMRIICRDDGERVALERLVGDDGTVAVQSGHGLGAALESAFRLGFASGCTAVGVLGSDNPTLPPAVLIEAFAALDAGCEVSIGPSEDGGYYLLAADGLYPDLFRNMAWSTSEVLAVTLERCAAANLRVHLAPEWYDVDDASDLDRLHGDLAGADQLAAPYTRAALATAPNLRWGI